MSRPAWFIAVAVAVAVSFDAAAECTPYWIYSWQDGHEQINLTATDYAVADFNDDGRADLAAITDTTVTVTFTTLNGTLGTTATLATGTGKFESITATDVTGDEVADIVVNDTTAKSLIVIPSHGDGTFGAAVTTTTPLAPTEFVAGDFTGDQKVDIAWANFNSATLAVWSGNNLGAFTQVSTSVLTRYPTTFVAADFDGDTKLDLYMAVNASVPGLALYRGNGDGTFVAPAELSVAYYLAKSARGG